MRIRNCWSTPLLVALTATLSWSADVPMPVVVPEEGLAVNDDGAAWLRRRDQPEAFEFLARVEGAQEGLLQLHNGTASAGLRLRVAPGGWQRVVVPRAVTSPGPGLRLRTAPGSPPVHLAASNDPAWPIPTGIDDARLLDLLDLQRPDLAAVRAAKEAGDLPGARAALARHFRSRTVGRITLPTAPGPGEPTLAAIEAGERVLRGEFTMLVNQHTFPGGRIDWHLDPTVGAPTQTHEWVWSIGRHEFALRLLAAQQASGEDRYARHWAALLRSWVEAMPVPAVDWERPGSGWRYIEAGLRMGEFWPDAGWPLITHPAVSDDDLLLFVRSAWEHGEFLARRNTGRNNHFVIGQTGLYRTACLFPEFKIAATWRARSASILQDFITSRCDADGGWYERSPSYHLWLIAKMARVLQAARLNGHEADFPPAFRAHLGRMAAWSVQISSPDRIIPALNDSTADALAQVCAPIIRDELPGEPAVAFAAGLVADTVPTVAPLPASVFLRDTGYGVMRTGWQRNAAYLLFDVGPMGGGHGHLDALNLIYAPDGRMTVFDGTGGTYNRSPFRTWSVSTASHNSVMVDQRSQNRPRESDADPVGLLPPDTPEPIWQEAPGTIYAAGWHVGGYGRQDPVMVRHRREILFRTTDGVTLVVDTLTPPDTRDHQYDLRWHLRSTAWSMDPAGRTVLPRHEDGSTLMALIPLAGGEVVRADSGVTEPEILGWDVIKGFPSRAPIPALTVRHLRQAAGPVVFVTALVPGSLLGGGLPTVETVPEGWRITLGGGRPPLDVRCQAGHLGLGDSQVGRVPAP